ncbi:hypothetical protein DUI87_09414 [Hirundo rustica rustica]|uniref:Uncharacterized protein n=1 Tax=Hirundo rustica rustica TaxID=333673 RepID=A0A3M0KU73_HIRRU|nr:hypothetical protein DUI87_09414 [Hirundo rustica rustica]
MQLAIFAAKAHEWLRANFLITRTSKSFSGSIPAPVKAGTCGYSSPAEVPLAQGACGRQHTPVVYQPLLLLCTTSKLAGGDSVLESMSFMMLNKHQHQYCPLELSTWDWPSAGNHNVDHKPPGWFFNHF